MSSLQTQFVFTQIALSHAERALANNEVPVGCIFVYNNSKILSTGANNTNNTLTGIMHAEIIGINEILNKFGLTSEANRFDKSMESRIHKLFAKIDLYVTVEPCVMCASLLRQVGINKVYFGAPNDRFGGNGSIYEINKDELQIGSHEPPQMLHSFDKKYISYPDFGREEAIILLRKFYVQENKRAPVPQTRESDNRFLSLTDFPVLDYSKFVTQQQFRELYGSAHEHRFNRCCDISLQKSTSEGILVETFFDPLMPISPELHKEMQTWEAANGHTIFAPDFAKIAPRDNTEFEHSALEYSVDDIWHELDSKKAKT